jgi:hypothetical protein
MSTERVGQRLSIDLFGTLDTHQNLMQEFLSKVKASGIRVYIITGAFNTFANQRLQELNFREKIHYDLVISIPSYLINHQISFVHTAAGKHVCDEAIWWKAKSQICKDMKIAVHLDTDYRYRQGFEGTKSRFIYVAETAIAGIEELVLNSNKKGMTHV